MLVNSVPSTKTISALSAPTGTYNVGIPTRKIKSNNEALPTCIIPTKEYYPKATILC